MSRVCLQHFFLHWLMFLCNKPMVKFSMLIMKTFVYTENLGRSDLNRCQYGTTVHWEGRHIFCLNKDCKISTKKNKSQYYCCQNMTKSWAWGGELSWSSHAPSLFHTYDSNYNLVTNNWLAEPGLSAIIQVSWGLV